MSFIISYALSKYKCKSTELQIFCLSAAFLNSAAHFCIIPCKISRKRPAETHPPVSVCRETLLRVLDGLGLAEDVDLDGAGIGQLLLDLLGDVAR